MTGNFPISLLLILIVFSIFGCSDERRVVKDFHLSIVAGKIAEKSAADIEPFTEYSGNIVITNEDQTKYSGYIYAGELASFTLDTCITGYSHYPLYQALENPLYVPIEIEPQATVEFKYKIYHYNSYNVPYLFKSHLLSNSDFETEVATYHDATKKQIILYAFIIGLLFAFLFYAAINLWVYKEPFYKYYIIYVLGSIFYSLLENERHLEFNIIFSTNPSLFIYLYSFFNVISIIAYITFFKLFLGIKGREILLHKIINGVTILLTSSILLDFILNLNGNYVLAFYQSLACRLTALFLGIYSILILARRKEKITNLILIGTLIWLLATLAYTAVGILKSKGLLSFSYYFNPHIILQVGTLFELTLFNIAINSRQQEVAIQNEINKEKLTVYEEGNRRVQNFYTSITHEFKTPLTIILGVADNLSSSEAILTIKNNANKLLSLINQLLQLSKNSIGTPKQEVKKINFHRLLLLLVDSYRGTATYKNIKLSLRSKIKNIYIAADEDMLKYILSNLIKNALDFTPKMGYVNVSLMQKRPNSVSIIIEDNGIGIHPEDLPHIFEKFYKGRNSFDYGSGIGLAMVDAYTTALGGTISVSSKLNQGSTFTVDFPTVNVEPVPQVLVDESQESSAELQLPVSNKVGAQRILVVEDNVEIAKLYFEILEPKFNVFCAPDGEVGLQMAYEEIPDLIISDIMMPEMDGFELCQAIKKDQRTSHIPVILLTAKSDQEDRLEGLKGGADAYLVKPFDKRELFIRIDKLLESREKLREHYQQFQMLPQEAVEENKFLHRIRTVIESNLGNEQFQIEDLAKEIHLSRTQIYRKLKALTGKTFVEILKEMKMHRAKELLTKTDKAIGEIALELGFSDPSYFSKVFKGVVGKAPSEMRKS